MQKVIERYKETVKEYLDKVETFEDSDVMEDLEYLHGKLVGCLDMLKELKLLSNQQHDDLCGTTHLLADAANDWDAEDDIESIVNDAEQKFNAVIPKEEPVVSSKGFMAKVESTLIEYYFEQVLCEVSLRRMTGEEREKSDGILDVLIILQMIEPKQSFEIFDVLSRFKSKIDGYEPGRYIPEDDYNEFTKELITTLNKPELNESLKAIIEEYHPKKYKEELRF